MRDPTLHALDPLTGVEKWKFKTHNEYARLPFFAGDRIFFTGNHDLLMNTAEDGTVYCLDHDRGTLIWNNTLPGNIGYPTIDGNHVYVSYGHDPTVVDSPQIAAGGIYALDASSGDELWNSTVGSPMGVPVVSDGIVYVGTWDYGGKFPLEGIFYPASLLAYGGQDGSELWNYTVGGWITPNLVVNGILYASANNSNICALDASNGRKLWNRTLESPLVVNGSLFGGYSGSVYCLDPSSGIERWGFKTDGDSVSPVVFAGNQVYFGSNGPQYFANDLYHTVCSLDAETGTKKWDYEIEGNAGDVAVSDGKVYVAAPYVTEESIDFEGNGSVYAIKLMSVAPQSPLDVPAFHEALSWVIAVVVVVSVVVSLFRYFRKKKR